MLAGLQIYTSAHGALVADGVLTETRMVGTLNVERG